MWIRPSDLCSSSLILFNGIEWDLPKCHTMASLLLLSSLFGHPGYYSLNHGHSTHSIHVFTWWHSPLHPTECYYHCSTTNKLSNYRPLYQLCPPLQEKSIICLMILEGFPSCQIVFIKINSNNTLNEDVELGKIWLNMGQRKLWKSNCGYSFVQKTSG